MSIFDKLLNWHLWTIKGYKLTEEIARGGMSTIYKATRRGTHEIIAIKILFPHFAKQKARVEKLFEEKQIEGEMTTNLEHPNVVKTFSYGKLRGRYYFVMEFVNGLNLKDAIYQEPEQIRGRKLDIIKQTAHGLKYIHSCGIIHRDMCPRNILLSENGEVKIIDFGVAISKTSRYTGLGERSGTPSYMAPEQIRALEADERTDIYSLGVMIYELLAEKTPFGGGDSFARMQHHLSSTAVPLSKRMPDIPPALEEIVSRAMQKQAKDRYKSMDDFLKDLDKVEFKGNPL